MKTRIGVLLVATAICVAIAFHFPAIPQDAAYHNFADTRTMLGIPIFGMWYRTRCFSSSA